MPYLDGSTGSRGNGYGFYAHGQQQIWAERDNPNKYVSVFAGAQVAPVNSISTMPLMTACASPSQTGGSATNLIKFRRRHTKT